MTKILPASMIDIGGQILTSEGLNMPKDKLFRDHWFVDPSASKIVEEPIEACRRQFCDQLRQKRERYFTDHDLVIMRLTRKKEIAGSLSIAEKAEYKSAEESCQALRDITKHPAITQAKSSDDLRKLDLLPGA